MPASCSAIEQAVSDTASSSSPTSSTNSSSGIGHRSAFDPCHTARRACPRDGAPCRTGMTACASPLLLGHATAGDLVIGGAVYAEQPGAQEGEGGVLMVRRLRGCAGMARTRTCWRPVPVQVTAVTGSATEACHFSAPEVTEAVVRPFPCSRSATRPTGSPSAWEVSSAAGREPPNRPLRRHGVRCLSGWAWSSGSHCEGRASSVWKISASSVVDSVAMVRARAVRQARTRRSKIVSTASGRTR